MKKADEEEGEKEIKTKGERGRGRGKSLGEIRLMDLLRKKKKERGGEKKGHACLHQKMRRKKEPLALPRGEVEEKEEKTDGDRRGQKERKERE